ncbi:MAG: hypothetical protein ACRD9L_26430, partial [Bryobacteraceae bacterium]
MANHLWKTAAIMGVVPLLAALGYTCWTFYARSQQDREIKREAQAKQAEDARKFLSHYGSDQVSITQFYATPQTVHPGGKVSLCYGVLSAKSLRMEPAVSDVYPALSHCVETTASKTTT